MTKIGLLGVGHLGKIHLKLLQEVEAFELVGFYDPNEKAAQAASEKFGVKAFDRLEDLLDAVDAVDIVTPTLSHYECAKLALERKLHIFIEKPLTKTLAQAEELIQLVQETGVKAQVGHVERFNPAFLAVADRAPSPMFIEGHRLAQWNPRGTDVSVVLDLMIHDLDIVLHLVKSPVQNISASGVAVISDTPDIANVRIEFENGCVANLTASRISMKNMRKLRFFQKNAYLSLDFLKRKAEVFRLSEVEEEVPQSMKFEFQRGEETRYLYFESPTVGEVNAIKMELEEFAASIQEDAPIRVPIEDGYAALRLAHQILESGAFA